MTIDPIEMEILGNKFASIAEEMCLTLQRTGRTLYVKETADFACALAGTDGRFFAYPRSIGVSGFVGLDCRPTIEAVEVEFGVLEEGDVILTNDPYRSSGLATHLPDLHMIAPFFDGDRLVAFGWCFVHCSDVGGRVASSISPTNTEIYQEGLRIPPVKLMRRGEMVPEVALFLSANSRTSEANMGDIRAMLAALATGRRRIAQTLDQHGADLTIGAQTALVAYAAQKARSVLQMLPEGTYRFADYLDDDAVSRLPVRIALTLSVEAGRVHLDFTGTDPQLAAAMNIPSCGTAHAWLTLRILALVQTLDPSAPLNGGLLDPVSVTLPKGTLVNPEEPAAVGVRHAAAIRVNDILNGALGEALPAIMPAAASGTVIPVVMSEPRSDGSVTVQVIEPLIGGTGARQGHDGTDARDSGISNLSNNPVETVEAELGITILRYAMRPDSGGAGRWRGGCGLELAFRVETSGSRVLARGMERMLFRPWGLVGGHAGMAGALVVNEGMPRERRLGKIDVLSVEAGDVVSFRTPGAGGWGDPVERELEAVLADIRNGVVSKEAARAVYGVVLCGDEIDREASRDHRAEMRSSRTGREAAGREQSLGFGSERTVWESVFPGEVMDRVNAHLMSLPQSRRQSERTALFESVLAGLPSNFPRTAGNEAETTAARRRIDLFLEPD